MQQAFSQLVTHTIGIGVHFYMFMNEAVWTAVEADLAGMTVGMLNTIEGHGDIVDGCEFPSDTNPADRLSRLTQSTAYHRGLAANRDVAEGVARKLSEASAVSPDEALRFGPEPASIATNYSAASVDIGRGLYQLECAGACFNRFARLPEPEDALTNYLDWLQPLLHFQVGAIILLGGIQQSLLSGRSLPAEAQRWFRNVDWILRCTDTSLRTLDTMIYPPDTMIYPPQSGSFFAASAGARYPSVLSLSSEIAQVFQVVSGLEIGLKIFLEQLSIWTGSSAQETAGHARTILDGTVSPMGERMHSIIQKKGGAQV